MRRINIAICLLACGSSSLGAQTVAGDTAIRRELAPGVSYRQFVDKTGPFVVNVVRVDLRRTDLELRHVRARDQLAGRETVADMTRRLAAGGANVLVAVNADFFNLQSGENENNQVIGGEWWKGLKNTDSPYDTYDNAHIQFGLDARRRPVMDRFLFDGRAWSRGTETPIITLNFNQPGNPEGVVLYTSRFGASTPRDTTRQTAEAAMSAAGKRGDTLLFIRRGAVSASSGSAIPADGAVLAAYGAGARLKEVQAMAEGDTVRILLATIPRLSRSVAPALLIGGWPRILRNGVNVANEAPIVEGTISRNAEARHPRSAVGFSRDSTTLFLLTVDGRQAKSVGMTLDELAKVMRALGAWNAMNFDGGGSTTMVIGGAVVNSPSDTGGARDVGNALVLVKR
ncbi:MAG TPA: phosphodiester glycosidase family protein [Gemmatimonadaceae bacterium]